jgi:hypothetical protein
MWGPLARVLRVSAHQLTAYLRISAQLNSLDRIATGPVSGHHNHWEHLIVLAFSQCIQQIVTSIARHLRITKHEIGFALGNEQNQLLSY